MKHLYINMCATIIVLMSLLSTSNIAAQEFSKGYTGALHFESLSIDYGTIREDGGSVIRTVKGENRGSEDILISEIVATCGCTTIDFKPCTLSPGESVSFAVRYDPMNRPGRIDKYIYVHLSSPEEWIRLQMTGYVVERERSIEELYPFDMGCGLRLRSNFHAFGYLEAGGKISESVGYINTSSRDIDLTMDKSGLSPHLQITLPKSVAAGERGDIIIGYTSTEEENIYGTIVDNITIYINGTPARYKLTTQVIAVDNFALTDDISAPKAAISKNIIKFGEVNCANAICEAEIAVQNTGQAPLIIRRIETTTEALKCSIEGATSGDSVSIDEAASVKLKIRLDTKYYADNDDIITERVRIITNDPMRPMQSIKVTAIPMWQ